MFYGVSSCFLLLKLVSDAVYGLRNGRRPSGRTAAAEGGILKFLFLFMIQVEAAASPQPKTCNNLIMKRILIDALIVSGCGRKMANQPANEVTNFYTHSLYKLEFSFTSAVLTIAFQTINF